MAGGQGEEGFRGSYQAELTGLAQSTLRCLASCLQFVPCTTNHDLTAGPLPVLPPGIQYFCLEFSTSTWNSVLPGIVFSSMPRFIIQASAKMSPCSLTETCSPPHHFPSHHPV